MIKSRVLAKIPLGSQKPEAWIGVERAEGSTKARAVTVSDGRKGRPAVLHHEQTLCSDADSTCAPRVILGGQAADPEPQAAHPRCRANASHGCKDKARGTWKVPTMLPGTQQVQKYLISAYAPRLPGLSQT